MKLIYHEPKDKDVVRAKREFQDLRRERRDKNKQRRNLRYGAFFLVAFNDIFVLLLILLKGRGYLFLSDKVILVLVFETVAQFATLLIIATKNLFSKE